MKSPFTGKEMKRIYEMRFWKFRGEEYPYMHTAWLCEDSGEQFTDDASDTAGYIQVTNQYREKYGIPYTDEIVAIRKRYGISAQKMSLILGIGINQYRLYEQGEVPVALFAVALAESLGHNGRAAGAKHKPHRGQDHQKRHDEVQGGEGGLSGKVGHEEPVHHAVYGRKHHHAHGRQREPDEPPVGEVIR